MSLYDVPEDFTKTITPTGSAVIARTTTPGQNASLPFDDTAGQRVSVVVTDGAFAADGTSLPANVSLTYPTAWGTTTTLGSCWPCSGTGFIDTMTLPALPALPVPPKYAVQVDPSVDSTGRATVALYTVPDDLSGNVTIPGQVTANITTPGQNAQYTFGGVANGTDVLTVTNSIDKGYVSHKAEVRVIDPSDPTHPLAQATVDGDGGSWTVTFVTPATKTYAINVNPLSDGHGNVTLALTKPQAPAPGKSPSPISSDRPSDVRFERRKGPA